MKEGPTRRWGGSGQFGITVPLFPDRIYSKKYVGCTNISPPASCTTPERGQNSLSSRYHQRMCVLTVQCWCFLPLSSLKIGCARQKVTFWTGEKGARLADVRHRVRISRTGKGFFNEGKGQIKSAKLDIVKAKQGFPEFIEFKNLGSIGNAFLRLIWGILPLAHV